MLLVYQLNLATSNVKIAPIGAAPNYSNKYLVRKGNQLILFKNKLDALNALNEQELDTTEPSASIEEDNAPEAVEIANKPIYDVSMMVDALINNEKALALINEQKYQQFVRMYESWIEEEELEMLLMAL